ncbi:MAG: hypothetical protein COW12_00085, partial [Candidatus Omnitrophica bacterium CG12_big_fil_rev_8_21_14_0_65_45_16]
QPDKRLLVAAAERLQSVGQSGVSDVWEMSKSAAHSLVTTRVQRRTVLRLFGAALWASGAGLGGRAVDWIGQEVHLQTLVTKNLPSLFNGLTLSVFPDSTLQNEAALDDPDIAVDVYDWSIKKRKAYNQLMDEWGRKLFPEVVRLIRQQPKLFADLAAAMEQERFSQRILNHDPSWVPDLDHFMSAMMQPQALDHLVRAQLQRLWVEWRPQLQIFHDLVNDLPEEVFSLLGDQWDDEEGAPNDILAKKTALLEKELIRVNQKLSRIKDIGKRIWSPEGVWGVTPEMRELYHQRGHYEMLREDLDWSLYLLRQTKRKLEANTRRHILPPKRMRARPTLDPVIVAGTAFRPGEFESDPIRFRLKITPEPDRSELRQDMQISLGSPEFLLALLASIPLSRNVQSIANEIEQVKQSASLSAAFAEYEKMAQRSWDRQGEIGQTIHDAMIGWIRSMAPSQTFQAVTFGVDTEGWARFLSKEFPTLQATDIRIEPFPDTLPQDHAFDFAFGFLPLAMMDWDRTISEMKRVVKPGGHILLFVDHQDSIMRDYFIHEQTVLKEMYDYILQAVDALETTTLSTGEIPEWLPLLQAFVHGPEVTRFLPYFQLIFPDIIEYLFDPSTDPEVEQLGFDKERVRLLILDLLKTLKTMYERQLGFIGLMIQENKFALSEEEINAFLDANGFPKDTRTFRLIRLEGQKDILGYAIELRMPASEANAASESVTKTAPDVQNAVKIETPSEVISKALEAEEAALAHLDPDIREVITDQTKAPELLAGERNAVLRRYIPYADKIHPDDWQAIKHLLTQNDEHASLIQNHTPSLIHLEHPFVDEHGEKIAAIQLKRISFDERELLEPHDGHGRQDQLFSASPDGFYVDKHPNPRSPQGAMVYQVAAREFVNTHLLHTNAAFNEKARVKALLAVGLFPNAKSFEENPLGFVMLGVPESGLSRLKKNRLGLKKARLYGGTLRLLHDLGFVHFFLHLSNMSIDFDGLKENLPVVHDLDHMQSRALDHLTEAQLLALMTGELRRTLAQIHDANGGVTKAEQIEFLKGYFGEDIPPGNLSPSEVLELLHAAVEIVMRPDVNVKIENIDFHPIIDRLKENVKVAAGNARAELRAIPATGRVTLKGGVSGIDSSATGLLDILDENRAPTGRQAMKKEIHQNGWWHQVAHIYLFDQHGRILLQKRSSQETESADKFQVAVSGHVDAGETPLEATLREGAEEVGITFNQNRLIPISKPLEIKREYPLETGFNREFVTVYAYVVTDEELEAIRQGYNLNEISELELIPMEDFEAEVRADIERGDVYSRTLRLVLSKETELWGRLRKFGFQSLDSKSELRAQHVKRKDFDPVEAHLAYRPFLNAGIRLTQEIGHGSFAGTAFRPGEFESDPIRFRLKITPELDRSELRTVERDQWIRAKELVQELMLVLHGMDESAGETSGNFRDFLHPVSVHLHALYVFLNSMIDGTDQNPKEIIAAYASLKEITLFLDEMIQTSDITRIKEMADQMVANPPPGLSKSILGIAKFITKGGWTDGVRDQLIIFRDAFQARQDELNQIIQSAARSRGKQIVNLLLDAFDQNVRSLAPSKGSTFRGVIHLTEAPLQDLLGLFSIRKPLLPRAIPTLHARMSSIDHWSNSFSNPGNESKLKEWAEGIDTEDRAHPLSVRLTAKFIRENGLSQEVYEAFAAFRTVFDQHAAELQQIIQSLTPKKDNQSNKTKAELRQANRLGTVGSSQRTAVRAELRGKHFPPAPQGDVSFQMPVDHVETFPDPKTQAFYGPFLDVGIRLTQQIGQGNWAKVFTFDLPLEQIAPHLPVDQPAIYSHPVYINTVIRIAPTGEIEGPGVIRHQAQGLHFPSIARLFLAGTVGDYTFHIIRRAGITNHIHLWQLPMYPNIYRYLFTDFKTLVHAGSWLIQSVGMFEQAGLPHGDLTNNVVVGDDARLVVLQDRLEGHPADTQLTPIPPLGKHYRTIAGYSALSFAEKLKIDRIQTGILLAWLFGLVRGENFFAQPVSDLSRSLKLAIQRNRAHFIGPSALPLKYRAAQALAYFIMNLLNEHRRAYHSMTEVHEDYQRFFEELGIQFTEFSWVDQYTAKQIQIGYVAQPDESSIRQPEGVLKFTFERMMPVDETPQPQAVNQDTDKNQPEKTKSELRVKSNFDSNRLEAAIIQILDQAQKPLTYAEITERLHQQEEFDGISVEQVRHFVFNHHVYNHPKNGSRRERKQPATTQTTSRPELRMTDDEETMMERWLRENENSPAMIDRVSGFFRADKPVLLEIGSGSTAHIAAMARRHPEINFIATDAWVLNPEISGASPSYHRYWEAWHAGQLQAQIDSKTLDNLVVLKIDAEQLLTSLPDHSVHQLLLVNPEPSVLNTVLDLILNQGYSKKLAPGWEIILKPFFPLAVTQWESVHNHQMKSVTDHIKETEKLLSNVVTKPGSKILHDVDLTQGEVRYTSNQKTVVITESSLAAPLDITARPANFNLASPRNVQPEDRRAIEGAANHIEGLLETEAGRSELRRDENAGVAFRQTVNGGGVSDNDRANAKLERTHIPKKPFHTQTKLGQSRSFYSFLSAESSVNDSKSVRTYKILPIANTGKLKPSDPNAEATTIPAKNTVPAFKRKALNVDRRLSVNSNIGGRLPQGVLNVNKNHNEIDELSISKGNELAVPIHIGPHHLARIEQAATDIKALLATENGRSELRQLTSNFNTTDQEASQAVVLSHSLFPYYAVFAVDAKQKNEPRAVIAVTEDERRQVEAINEAIGPVIMDGKAYDVLTPFKTISEAVLGIQGILEINDVLYATREMLEIPLAERIPGVHAVRYTQSQLDQFVNSVEGLLKEFMKLDAVANLIAQMA